MMKNRIKPVILILLAIVALGGGYWFYRQNPDTLVQLQRRLGILGEAQASETHTVSGYIEADEINLATETSGRIMLITLEEGDLAHGGQILVELDTALLEADVRQAKARIATAKAQLAKIKAGVRAEEIAKAEAAVAVAEAAAEAAYTRWQDAIHLRDNPQELDRQIDAARTTAELLGPFERRGRSPMGTGAAQLGICSRTPSFLRRPSHHWREDLRNSHLPGGRETSCQHGLELCRGRHVGSLGRLEWRGGRPG
jgi:multidrug efflux pump subunit AcrA (membrane-fusion protein)